MKTHPVLTSFAGIPLLALIGLTGLTLVGAPAKAAGPTYPTTRLKQVIRRDR